MKVSLVTFFPDNTYQERRCAISKHGKIQYDKTWQPQVKTGLSQFPGRKSSRFSFRKAKTRYFGFYGEPHCYTLDEFKGKLNATWDKAESQAFIKKAMAFALVTGKPFSNLQVYLIVGVLGFLVVINFLILRRIGF